MEKKIDTLPLTSTHWGTYRARVTNGRVQELYGFEYDNDPSPIGSGIDFSGSRVINSESLMF